MFDAERELFKLGIPAKTRHNEVAPGQFEIAPVFERSNVASDHQQLLMVILKRVAQKHGMECLFHEKPFAGINGSGKHINFSLGNGSEGNLLLPGDTPHDNAQFLVFCAAVIRAVHTYGGLLRASVASATNDHRLGANEAPPAIISIFLGDQLTDVFDQIAKGGATSSKEKGALTIGVDTLPVLPTDPGDRNRTSPFAFTGNRFEFRAPGSLQSIAGPMVTINTILAEALDHLATELESRIASGTDFNVAVQQVLEEVMSNHGSVVFNGDGYTEDWKIEAEARGLPNLVTTLDALPVLITDKSMELFSHYGVFSPREMHSRYEIALEQYAISIGVEARFDARDGQHRRAAGGTPLPDGTRHERRQPPCGRYRRRHRDARRSLVCDRRPARSASRRCAVGARGRRGRDDRARGRTRRNGVAPGDGDGPGVGRRARDPGGRRPLAHRHLPGDALHAVMRSALGRRGFRVFDEQETHDRAPDRPAQHHRDGEQQQHDDRDDDAPGDHAQTLARAPNRTMLANAPFLAHHPSGTSTRGGVRA